MASALLLNPTLISSSFLGQRLSIRGDSKKIEPCCLIFRGPRCSLDAQYGGNILTFPRTNICNPYKRLGIPVDASEEEVWSAQNFLLDQYAGHERSVESFEAAFEKMLMTSFLGREKNQDQHKNPAKKEGRRFSTLV